MYRLFFLFLLSCVATGCDSSDADSAIVGTWQLRLLEDEQGDQRVKFDKEAESLIVHFGEDGDFSYTLDFSRTDDIVLEGEYETQGSAITMKPTGQEVIEGGYLADGTGALLLEFPADVSERLLGPGYTGTVRLSLTSDEE